MEGIIREYDDKREDTLSKIRVLSEIYLFHPREAAIRLASATGNMLSAIREYEMNPRENVFDYNDWNTLAFDDIVDRITEKRTAFSIDDYVFPNSNIELSTRINHSVYIHQVQVDEYEDKNVEFIRNKKKKRGFSLIGSLMKKNKDISGVGSNGTDNLCGVCSESSCWKTECLHTYCDKCAKNWFVVQNKNSCPICRSKVLVCLEI